MKPGMDELDDITRDLRAELVAVEPSPAFAAGVRQKIEAGGSAWTRLTLTLALAMTAFAVVAGGAYWMIRQEALVPASAVPVAQVVTPPVAADPIATPETASSRRTSARVKPAIVAPARASAGPFLEVITNQPDMIRKIWAGIEGGVARVGLPANEFEEITVAPVRVDAIVVPAIGPPGGPSTGSGPGGGLVPGARRVVVDDSARGDQR